MLQALAAQLGLEIQSFQSLIFRSHKPASSFLLTFFTKYLYGGKVTFFCIVNLLFYFRIFTPYCIAILLGVYTKTLACKGF